ncbi:hypothetical protein B0H13DRAFT_1906931 [Mycena leptocephala]|nr:hypothetical protein B0H13DRAFT_1906931 [Mycena leptocephala]
MPPTKKEAKPKEMFKPYDRAAVPDIMPFPELAGVATTKGEETAVPKLNQHQRSWIHDVALRGIDLASLSTKAAAAACYNKIKTDAFDEKAFQHVAQDGDHIEEGRLPALITAWKRENAKKNKKSVENDIDATEEDEGARVGLLRGYTKAGWRLAIQKVLSNKRTAENSKRKAKGDTGESVSDVPALALAKLFGLGAYTGRDKFREDRHDEINKYSKSLPGAINAGGKFRKAEALLWAKEDQASWNAAAATDEDVDWKERQTLVAGGFKHMVTTLNASGKFRPFVATMVMGWLDERGKVELEWAEAVSEGVRPRQPFTTQYKQLADDCLDAMYTWAEKPLKDYVAARDHPLQTAPIFPLTAEALNDISPNALAHMVSSFLVDSYQAAFGTREIPWEAIASAPSEYYDTGNFDVVFASSGLAGLKGGTSGFFRKACPMTVPAGGENEAEQARIAREEEQARVDREEEQAHVDREEEQGRIAREEEQARVDREKEQARVDREKEQGRIAREEEQARVDREKEQARIAREEEQARADREKEQARIAREEEQARADREKEQARIAREEEQARIARAEEEKGAGEERITPDEDEEAPLKKRGRKRKAEYQLRPEDAGEDTGVLRRTGRTRQTPQEAKAEREKKVAATVGAAKVKPSYEYVIVMKSPVKPKQPSTKSTRVGEKLKCVIRTPVRKENLS